MKEIYDTLKPSEEYTAGLDEKLPANRVPSRIKRKYAREAQYVKTFPKILSSKSADTVDNKQKSEKEAPFDQYIAKPIHCDEMSFFEVITSNMASFRKVFVRLSWGENLGLWFW